MEPTLERAFTTASSVLFSKFAAPCTTRTRLGTTSARRWYWFSTSAQAALTLSSRTITSLYPQPLAPSSASRHINQTWLALKNGSPQLPDISMTVL
jgi:hypothetical protein